MHDPVVMQVGDRTRDGVDQLGGVVLVKELFGADTVEELAAFAEVSDEVDYCGGAVWEMECASEKSA